MNISLEVQKVEQVTTPPSFVCLFDVMFFVDDDEEEDKDD